MSFKSQPKFKFGDKVKEEGNSPFTISLCFYDRGVWFYGDDIFKPKHSEARLQIYQEPKPKRKITLYRYIFSLCSGEIKASYETSLSFDEYYDANPCTRIIKLLATESREIEVDA